MEQLIAGCLAALMQGGRTNAGYEDGHSHDKDATVGLATQLVRVMGVDNVQSYAGYIADFVVLSWLDT